MSKFNLSSNVKIDPSLPGAEAGLAPQGTNAIDDLNEQNKKQGMLPVWNEAIDIDTAKDMRSKNALAPDLVSKLSEFESRQNTLLDNNFEPLVQPPTGPEELNRVAVTGNPTRNIGKVGLDVDPNERIVGPEGKRFTSEVVKKLQDEQRNREARIFRKNNRARHLENANDLDLAFKNKKFSLPDINQFKKSVKATGDSANNILINIKKDVNENPYDINFLDHVKNTYGVTANQASLVMEDSFMDFGKLLMNKRREKEVSSGNEILDLFQGGLEDLPVEISSAAFHDENGNVGIEISAAARYLDNLHNSRYVEATGQKNNSDILVRKGLIETGLAKNYFTIGKHQNTDGKGNPKGPEVEALFIEKALFDNIRSYGDYANTDPIKIGAVAATGGGTGAIGEFALVAKKDTRRPTGTVPKTKQNNMFTNFTDTLANGYRKYDNDALNFEVILLNTGIDINKKAEEALATGNLELAKISPREMEMYKHISNFYNLIPWNKISNEKDPEIQADYAQSNSRKLESIAKQTVNAYQLQSALPNGHKVGPGIKTDPSSERNYVYSYNSSEQNSTVMRGLLSGYSSETSRSLFLKTKGDQNLISPEDLKSLYSLAQRGGKISPARREQIYILMIAREMAIVEGQGGGSIPDDVLIRNLTPNVLRKWAEQGTGLLAMNNPLLEADPSNTEKRLLNPLMSPTIDINKLADMPNDIWNGVSNGLKRMSEDPKHHGAVFQMLKSLSKYVDAGEAKSVLNTFNVFPDMNSGGRWNAILSDSEYKAVQAVSRMGFFLDQAAQGENVGFMGTAMLNDSIYPFGNPRLMIAEAIVYELEENLGNDYDKQIGGLLTDLFNSDEGAKLADDFIKNPAMVVDYGMAITGAAKVAIDRFYKMIRNADEIAQSKGEALASDRLEQIKVVNNLTSEGIEESLRESVALALGSLSNPSYSANMQKMGIALGMLNIPLVFDGYGNSTHRIGQTVRKPIFNSKVTMSTKSGDILTSFKLEDEYFSDAPGHRKEVTFRKIVNPTTKEVSYEANMPSVYSAQAMAASPAVGHYTERAMISRALEIFESRFGKLDNNVIDGHDSIGMDFADSFLYQDIFQNEAIFDILEENLPRKQVNSSRRLIADKVKELIKKSDSIRLGNDSDYSHITEYLDDIFKGLSEVSIDNDVKLLPGQQRNKVQAIDSNLNMLREANQKGIWSPIDRTRLTIASLSGKTYNFDYLPNIREDNSFLVDTKKFFNWYTNYFYNPLSRKQNNELTSAKATRSNVVDAMKKVSKYMRGTFRNGREL